MLLKPDSLLTAAAILLGGFGLSAVLTPVVRALARRYGAVATPRKDRWHAKPTAMLGGIAMFASSMATIVLTTELTLPRIVVLGASTAMFLLGLIDDQLEFKPYQKLIGQFMAASVVVYFGLILPWTWSPLLNMAITFVWLIGITNAVNLLDNMDGLAAGVSAIAAICLAVNFFQNHQYAEVLALCAFAGALLGFLIYNHNPASIFMGDCGSMFIGFFLASTALLSGTGGGRSRSVVAVLAVPVLVLFVPIFDTTFVALMRKLAGRSMMKGGRDHTSHRLVALGLSERRAVWLLYALASTSGVLGLFARGFAIDVSAALVGAFIIGLTFLGLHLAHVRVYEEAELAAAREKPLVSFLFELSYKRRVFEVALDAVLIALAYYTAYALKFGAFDESSDWALFVRTLPVIVCLKLATLLAAGVYRGLWRYTSLHDVLGYARAVALSSAVVVVAIVLFFHFAGFSRTVFILDGVLLLGALTASRFAFRILRRAFPPAVTETAQRVLIYGAGDGGELVYRELRNNHGLDLVPVAFLDDDPAKAGRLIHGLRVYYPYANPLLPLCERLQATAIVISSEKITGERLARFVGECATSGIAVTRAFMKFQPLAASDFGWVLSADAAKIAPAPLIASRAAAHLLHASSLPEA